VYKFLKKVNRFWKYYDNSHEEVTRIVKNPADRVMQVFLSWYYSLFSR